MAGLRTEKGRRYVALAVPLTIATLLLSGCGRTDTRGESDGSDVVIDDKPAIGTIEFWAGGADGQALPELLKDFESANPNVKVKITEIPSDDFDAKLTAAITSGTVPDMVYMQSQAVPSLLNTGGFAAVPNGLVDPNSFFETIYNTGVIDGTAYALPWYTFAQVLITRKDLNEAAGVEPPKTWDEMRTYAEALKAEGVPSPFALDVGYDGFSAQALLSYATQNGGSFINDDYTEWTINSPENVEALEFWGSLVKDGYASPDGPGFLDTVPFFSNGTIAGIVQGPWFPGWLNDANGAGWTDDHVSVTAPAAGADGNQAIVGGGSLGVLNDAKNSDASWKLVRWLSEPDVQAKWFDIFGNLPAVKAGWDADSIASNDLLNPVKDAVETGVAVPPVPTWAQVASQIGEQMERVARGTATPQEALDEAQRQAETIGTGTR